MLTLNRTNIKRTTPRHIRIKLPEIENYHKSSQWKKSTLHTGQQKHRMKTNLSETMQPRRQ
jgi:hypothetical protein